MLLAGTSDSASHVAVHLSEFKEDPRAKPLRRLLEPGPGAAPQGRQGARGPLLEGVLTRARPGTAGTGGAEASLGESDPAGVRGGPAGVYPVWSRDACHRLHHGAERDQAHPRSRPQPQEAPAGAPAHQAACGRASRIPKGLGRLGPLTRFGVTIDVGASAALHKGLGYAGPGLKPCLVVRRPLVRRLPTDAGPGRQKYSQRAFPPRARPATSQATG
jgi:hypothetical protein